MASQLVIPTSYSIYAPLRFEVTRKYSRNVAEALHSLAGIEGDWPLRERAKEYVLKVNKGFLNGGLISELAFFREVENLVAYVDFASSGRIIYDFHNVLVKALLLTDIDKIDFIDIPFPQDNFYLHFGELDWPDNPESSLEGVYVSKKMALTEGVEWCFTPVYKKQFSVPLHIKENEETRNSELIIKPDDISMGIDEYCKSIDATWDKIYNDLEGCAQGQELEAYKLMHTMNSRDNGNPKENSLIVKLSINCMLYIAAAPSDEIVEWDDRAPPDLVHQAVHSEKNGTRITAENTLHNQYYLKIRKIGNHFAHLSSVSGEHISGRKISHLRRGHFRNQAFGPEWKNHRYIFIAPQIIHPDDHDVPGRIYEV